jgi:hypothetical protein
VKVKQVGLAAATGKGHRQILGIIIVGLRPLLLNLAQQNTCHGRPKSHNSQPFNMLLAK